MRGGGMHVAVLPFDGVLAEDAGGAHGIVDEVHGAGAGAHGVARGEAHAGARSGVSGAGRAAGRPRRW